MNKYKGLFTFDVDNHRYVPVGQADGIIDFMDYRPDEEPKDKNYWYIDDLGRIQFSSKILDEVDGYPNNWIARKLIGNYFSSREEAEQAVEKLRAFKRLKDKGFRFIGIGGRDAEFTYPDDRCDDHNFWADVKLLFGGEE